MLVHNPFDLGTGRGDYQELRVMADLLDPSEYQLLTRLVASPHFCWAVPGSRREGTIFPEVVAYFGLPAGHSGHEVRDTILRLVDRNLISAVWERPIHTDSIGRHRETAAVSRRERPDPLEWDLRSLALLGSGRRMYEAHTHARTVPLEEEPVPVAGPRLSATATSDAPDDKAAARTARRQDRVAGKKPATASRATGTIQQVNASRRTGQLDTSRPPSASATSPRRPAATPAVSRYRNDDQLEQLETAPLTVMPADAPMDLVILEILERHPNLIGPGGDATGPLLLQLDLRERRPDVGLQEELNQLIRLLRELNRSGDIRLNISPRMAITRIAIATPGRTRLAKFLSQTHVSS